MAQRLNGIFDVDGASCGAGGSDSSQCVTAGNTEQIDHGPPPGSNLSILKSNETRESGYRDDRPLVNYLWISKTDSSRENRKVSFPALQNKNMLRDYYGRINDQATDQAVEDPLCHIGLQYIERAVQNANRYPHADFKIWLDKEQIDAGTHFWVCSFIYNMAAHKNQEVCDLRNIPDYANSGLFNPGYLTGDRSGTDSVYVRADYARVLVLDYCMQEENNCSQILYSDMDCPDLRLREAVSIIDRYGIVINNMSPKIVSHGYIGIAPENEKVGRNFPDLKNDARRAARAGLLGYGAFEIFLNNIGMPYGAWRETIGLKNVLPDCQVKVQPGPFISELGVS